MRQKLKNGDTVEILTNPKQKPSKDWLSFVKTSRARNKIRTVIRAEQRRRSKEIGRELEKDCKRHKINLNRKWRAGDVGKAAEELGFKNTDELLVALGYGKVSSTRVIEQFLTPEQREEAKAAIEDTRPSRIAQVLKRPGKKAKSGILVEGMDDVMVRFAKCCNPIPGDRLIGVITRGRGITVHADGCRRVRDADPDRRIEVNWSADQALVHTVGVRVRCDDRPGLLANVTSVLSEAACYPPSRPWQLLHQG